MNYNSESCPLTLNTTRICASDAIGTSIEVSKIGFTNMKPNAVILVNQEEVFNGIAATSLVHFPINASLLFTDGNSLKKETLDEIQRLSPKVDKRIPVILVGKISKKVSSELNCYGFRTHHILGGNPYETACMISKVRKEFKNILIMSGEDYSEGIVVAYWAAHHGDPILFVKKDKIPDCTLDTIKKMNDINVYIVGSTKTISKRVEDCLDKLNNVKHLDRICGENPYEIAVNFAKYKDHKTGFGWGRNYKEGHAFTFGELHHPMEIVAGVIFAHMGKHTPLLLTKKDQIPEVVERYIRLIKYMPPKGIPRPPFMHGFILGPTKGISNHAQIMIEEKLSIDHEMMDMNHDMHHEDHVMCMEQPMDKTDCMHNSECMCMHEMHNQNQMMKMEHDMGKSEGMKDSGCISMHEMHYPDQMMKMEHVMGKSECMKDSGCMPMHEMYHPDQMMHMENNMGKSSCMKDSGCMFMNEMHHSDQMMKMEHDMGKSEGMKDSGYMSMHEMHDPDQMMHMENNMGKSSCMKDSGYMPMHEMHHSDQMMKMEHVMGKSECMKDSGCMSMHEMYHPDQMMHMENNMGESSCMKDSGYMPMHEMHHSDQMMKIEHDMGKSEGMKDSGYMPMHEMHDPDQMMKMEHYMDNSEGMKDSGCMSMHEMHNPDHMMHMESNMNDAGCMDKIHYADYTMNINHEEDKDNKEMCPKCEHEKNKNNTIKYSSSNYIIVSIDEILS